MYYAKHHIGHVINVIRSGKLNTRGLFYAGRRLRKLSYTYYRMYFIEHYPQIAQAIAQSVPLAKGKQRVVTNLYKMILADKDFRSGMKFKKVDGHMCAVLFNRPTRLFYYV